NSKFSGEVHDFHDGSPIINATIYIETLDKYTTSDINGKFSVENLCNGKITLVVSHLACETKHLDIEISGDTYSVINLEHHIEELNEVKVDGIATPKLTKTSQETLLKTNAIERFSALSL